MRNQSSINGPNATDWGAASRPSKTNPSASQSEADTADPQERLSRRRRDWKRKNEICDQLLDEFAGAHLPVSVVESTTLREDCARERDHGYRSKSLVDCVRVLLGKYNDYKRMHLRFHNPDGELVRAPMLFSHMPAYGDKYYAKIMALERQILKEFDNPHVVMLTLTGSTENATGGPRCPADHLRDVVNPFENNVRPALHRSLDVDRWEYAKVIENHQSGYGHKHVAIFVDGEVSESDFYPAIDAHLKHCKIAHRDAHDYHHPDPDERPIRVNKIDPDADPESEDTEAVANLGSYIGEYIGAYGEDLLDRSLADIAFRAVCFATSTQRVTFSTGSQDLIDKDQPPHEPNDETDTPARYEPDTDVDDLKAAAKEPGQSVAAHLEDSTDGWSLDGIGIVDEHGETRHDIETTGVQYVEIEGAEQLDPPNLQPPDRPIPPREDTSITDFGLV